MDKAQKVLEILDKHGFDWWGLDTTRELRPIDSALKNTYRGTRREWSDRLSKYINFNFSVSLADLATNKSALEAAQKVNNKKQPMEYTGDSWRHCLLVKLIEDLIYNNGDNFWDIWLDFMGEEQSE